MARTQAVKSSAESKKTSHSRKQDDSKDKATSSISAKSTATKRETSPSAKARHAVTPVTKEQENIIRSTIYDLVSRTRASSTICPSQVPRHLHAAHPEAFPDWRALMQPVRDVAWEQARQGIIEVTQGGNVRPWEQRNEIKGPIRLRRGKNWVDPKDSQGD